MDLKEKLCTSIGEDLDIILEWVSKEEPFVGSEPPYFDIAKPGRYVVESERTVQPRLIRLKKLWAELTDEERQGFITGLEAARIPAAKTEEFPF
jgi:hypothetical protein